MNDKNGVSIIVPVYNEEKAIVTVIHQLLNMAQKAKIQVQVVVVDDGSTDTTPQKIAENFSGHPSVSLVSHHSNRGVGIARNTGIEHSRFEVVGMIDADETYPAESIPDLVGKMNEYDMAVGARVKEKGSLRFFRKFAKDFIRKLAEYLFDTKIPDLNSGLRFFKKSIVLKYTHLLPPGHSWVSTITLALLANGHSVCFVPIDYYPRIKGRSSFHPFRDTYNYLLLVLRACTYFNPLKIFAPLFLTLILFSVIKTAVDLFIFHTIQESDIILFVFAFLILILGLLADLIVVQGKRTR